MPAAVSAAWKCSAYRSWSTFDPRCGSQNTNGTHVNRTVPCVVPALGCVESQVTGTFEGTALTVITSFDPATQLFTGTVTNFLTNGAVIHNTIALRAGVPGSVITITGGTRQFAHATGTSVTTPPTADGPGTSVGEYCLGNGGDGD